MSETMILTPGAISPAELERIYRESPAVALTPDCRTAVEAAADVVAEAAAGDEAVYGVNTGFGALAKTRIEADQVTTLQHRLVLSHSAGTGALLPDGVPAQRIPVALEWGGFPEGTRVTKGDPLFPRLELIPPADANS